MQGEGTASRDRRAQTADFIAAGTGRAVGRKLAFSSGFQMRFFILVGQAGKI